MRAVPMRRLFADRALTACVAVLFVMALTGIALVIAGWIQGDSHTAGNGGVWLFFAAFLAIPGCTGWWLARRQRKISVERKLDEVAGDLDLALDGLGRIEEHLVPKATPLALVREFPNR